jgi:hypothetical protein
MNELSIPLLCTIIGALLGIVGYIKTSKKDTKEEAGNAVRVEAKLDYVAKGVDDIRLDMKDHSRQIKDISERLTRVEESTKSAHHRIDGIEKGE